MTHDNDKIEIDFELAPPDKLYAHNRRQLSAMLDGELSPDQARFMLRRLQHDSDLAACWERWQVCGDLLRGHGHALLPSDFSKRVADAIAAPEATAGVRSAAGRSVRGSHRLLRWGGGALAASMALVALFMARELPVAHTPQLVDAAGPAPSAPAQVQGTPTVALAGSHAPAATEDPAPANSGAAELLAAAAPAVMAVAEVPRRAGERSSTRSQSQRAAMRRSQAVADARQRAVAAVEPPPSVIPRLSAPGVDEAGIPMLANLSPASMDGDALFGTLPATASARPWPRAVLPGLAGTQPFAARYGLPAPEAFAPFQPRLERPDASRPNDEVVPPPVEPEAAVDPPSPAGAALVPSR